MRNCQFIYLLSFTLLFVLLITPVWGQDLTHIWSHSFGGDETNGSAEIGVDGSGNVFVTGNFKGTGNLGCNIHTSVGGSDIFVAKYDAAGNCLWSHIFGDTINDLGTGLAVDEFGNVIVVGYFRGTIDFGGGPRTAVGGTDIFMVKLDSAGNHVWSKQLGAVSEQAVASDVAVDASDNILVTGWITGNVDFGGGPLGPVVQKDIYVVKYAPDGTHLWSKNYDSSGDGSGSTIATDADENVIVNGWFKDSVDFGGGPLASVGGSIDIFLAKFDAAGNYMWAQCFGGAEYDSGHEVAIDGAGNVFMTGFFENTVSFGGASLTSAGFRDIFLAKYAPNGTHLWSQRFGGIDLDEGNGLAVDGLGNVISTGIFEYNVDFGGETFQGGDRFDIFLAKHDPDGNHICSYQFASLGWDVGSDVSADALGNVLLTGYFRGSGLDFGGGPLDTPGYRNSIYVAKFAPDLPPPVTIQLDIKPTSCPNPFNVQLFEFAEDGIPMKGGVLPVAILGTDNFDINDIDMETLLLEGVAPIMRGGGPKVEDVAAPALDSGECACTKAGPDGLSDLTMKFAAQDIASAISPGEPGETRALTMTGMLLDGTPFEMQDCIVFVGPKTIPVISNNSTVILGDAVPNPFNPITRINYYLPRNEFVKLNVYDVTGKLVQELVEQQQPAGEHFVEWNADRMPSGVYFYCLKAGGKTLTKKMVLLK
jgi:hypothetical protein